MKTNLLNHGITLTGEINGHKSIVVPLSGGKDSQSCLKLAIQAHAPSEVLALFCDTGYEHPITYAHVTATAKLYGVDLVTLSAGTVKSICELRKRLPGGGARHCTDSLKITPSKYFYKYFSFAQGGFEVWYGMRSDESAERETRYRGRASDDLIAPHEVFNPTGKKKKKYTYPKYLEKQGVMFRLPVVDWSKSEVFELLDGEENELYAKGFDRVGCFPCLASGEAWQMKAFEHDATGYNHYKIALEIADNIGRNLFDTKRFKGKTPKNNSGCAFCEY